MVALRARWLLIAWALMMALALLERSYGRRAPGGQRRPRPVRRGTRGRGREAPAVQRGERLAGTSRSC
jgi:hypothetical protein